MDGETGLGEFSLRADAQKIERICSYETRIEREVASYADRRIVIQATRSALDSRSKIRYT